MENKKGLSTIVTTLIIILLVLVAIGIVWVVVRGVIEGGTDQIDVRSKCIEVGITVLGNTTSCEPGTCTISIMRDTATGDFDGVSTRIAAGTSLSPAVEQAIKLEEGAQNTVSATGIANADKIIVTPYIESNGENVLCSNSFEYTID